MISLRILACIINHDYIQNKNKSEMKTHAKYKTSTNNMFEKNSLNRMH